MKKTLLLRLCLILTVALSLYSCQQDYLPEKETYSNSSAFQLTSKKISLKDARHRAKLIPEIEKIEAGLKTAARNNALGKVIDYGNGVSIDTDEVVYIENGPDYHTYTFHITREGADENAPLENLVLSPLTDGTYRELLFTYTLTPAEKENIANGFPIDTKGKVNVIELAQGTYNSGSVLAKSSCNWVETTVWVPCSENLHDGSNFQDCRFVTHPGEGTPPRAYIVEQFECLLESDPGPGTGGGGSIGGGGFGGGGSQQNPPKGAPTYPCDGSGVSTGPQQPILTDGNGTCSGTPTIPYTPTKNDPCAKIKAKFADTRFKEKYDELNKPENFDLDHELAYVMRYPPIGTNIPPAYFKVDMPPCSTGNGNAVMPSNDAGIAGVIHTHNNEDCNGKLPVKVPSPVDIKYLLNTLLSQANQYTGSYSNAYSITITSEGSYMLMYTGTAYPGSLNYDTVKKLKEDYARQFQELSDDGKATQPNIEREFVKFMKEKINKPGLEVYRITPTSAVKLEYDPNSPNSIKETPCP